MAIPLAAAAAAAAAALWLLVGHSSAAAALSSADSRTVLRVRRTLNLPPSLTPAPRPSRSSPFLSITWSDSGRLSGLHIRGPIPNSAASPPLSSLLSTLSRLRLLSDLTLSSLSLSGPLPSSLSRLRSLRSLDLSLNLLNSSLPDLSSLSVLSHLNLSHNRLSSAVPSTLLSLPSLATLDLSSNAFTSISPNSTCGARLASVDISGNPIPGDLPPFCISSNTSRASSSPRPLAVALPPPAPSRRNWHAGIIAGSVMAVAALVLSLAAVALAASKRRRSSDGGGASSGDLAEEKKRWAANARTGMYGSRSYRTFDIQTVEEMTDGFDPCNLLEEQNTTLFYKGWLQDGTAVTVRKLEMGHSLSNTGLRQFTDATSKLRHRHIVSVVGHSVLVGDRGSDTTVYLMFERFSNGTLRSHLSTADQQKKETLKWPQRLSAMVGVARGIQFLHTRGIHGNNIKMENILMDEALTTKINNYALPFINAAKTKANTMITYSSSFGTRDHVSNQSVDSGNEDDIHQFGLVLLEIITGKITRTERELEVLKLELQGILTESITELHRLVDCGIHGTFTYESLKTAIQVALSCLSDDGLSMDDLLWQLQYSQQVQYACASSGRFSAQSFSFDSLPPVS